MRNVRIVQANWRHEARSELRMLGIKGKWRRWGSTGARRACNFPACAPVHAEGKPSACWSKCRGLLSVRKLFYLKRSAVELYASEAEPGLNAAKTKRAIVTPDLRILGLYDDAAEGMSDFYLSLSLADRQESWESSVARVNSSTERCEYIFHVSRESRLFHLGNCKRCIVTRWKSRLLNRKAILSIVAHSPFILATLRLKLES